MVRERVRMYSRQERVPVDVIAPEHDDVHRDLERWGAWNRERYSAGACASIEGDYDPGPGREPKRPVVALPPDPILRQIEGIVVMLLSDLAREQHGETLKEFYCKRWEPKTICWAHALRYEDFGKWMFDCRQMVVVMLGGVRH